MATWQLQEAKSKFSNVVEKAVHEGPQFVTKHGKRTVVIVSADDFERYLTNQSDLKTFLLTFPGEALDLSRSKDTSRDISL